MGEQALLGFTQYSCMHKQIFSENRVLLKFNILERANTIGGISLGYDRNISVGYDRNIGRRDRAITEPWDFYHWMATRGNNGKSRKFQFAHLSRGQNRQYLLRCTKMFKGHLTPLEIKSKASLKLATTSRLALLLHQTLCTEISDNGNWQRSHPQNMDKIYL